MIRAAPRIVQHLIHRTDQGLAYEYTHDVTGAPWIDCVTSRAPVPAHLQAVLTEIESALAPHVVSDGTTTLTLEPRITGLRLIDVDGGHEALVNIAWFLEGVPTHGELRHLRLAKSFSVQHRRHQKRLMRAITVRIGQPSVHPSDEEDAP